MGICIGITVSTLTPKEKWRAVYEEALHLAKKMDLADEVEKELHGHTVRCLAPIEETKWNDREGWWAVADYEYGDPAEGFFFPRELYGPESRKPIDILAKRAHDIGLIELEKNARNYQEIWGNKTQGHFYHYGLLAVGCLVQDRLGDDALVHSDINAGQCREAVSRANELLGRPIQVPCQCDPDRWMGRIGRLTVGDMDRVRIAVGMYIGKKNAVFGEKLKEVFPAGLLHRYWEEEFARYGMDTIGFQDTLKLYLTMGFDIAELCGLMTLEDKDGNSLHEKFIRLVMDAKLHWKEKDCSDIMEQDPDDPTLYGIEALFVRILGRGARNKKVDRYIPIDALRGTFHEKFGGGCDVDAIVDAYLLQEWKLADAGALEGELPDADAPEGEPAGTETTEGKAEADQSDKLNRLMNRRRDEFRKEAEKYEIYDERMLQFYAPGFKIMPRIEQGIRIAQDFADTLAEENAYIEAAAKTAWEQGEWIAAASGHIPSLRDRDWEQIFRSLEKDPDSFRRYYCLFRISLDDRKVQGIVTALIVNDDLYEYARKIQKEAARQ